MCQIKNSSYKKMFSVLEKIEEFFEVDVLSKIKDDYIKLHNNNLKEFIELADTKITNCPKCNSELIIHY